MERSAPECLQSGLPSPHPSHFGDTISEVPLADHASAAPSYIKKEVPSAASVTSLGTPTSEQSAFPPSSRTTTSPQQIQRTYQPVSSASSGGMAQQPNSPSMPQTGRRHQAQPVNSDNDVPIDPSIAAQNSTYPYGQHPAYAPAPQMTHYAHPSGAMYAPPRPDWTYPPHHGHMAPGHPVYAPPPASAPPHRPNHQVYSFVPIPGAQPHKRPRRKYEQIERLYRCGHGDCAKGYGTLNHLNAHVNMQGHGPKRSPEEFKEIRKQWKQRKKEEEAQRKAEEERQRAQAAAAAQHEGAEAQADGTVPSTYMSSRSNQLPPIGLQQSNQYPAPPSANVGGQPMAEYPGHLYTTYPPHSPYGQTPTVYAQSNGGQAPGH